MPILHVRNVPGDLYEHIRRLAQEHNRSISAQVIHLLERAVLESPQAQRHVLENIRRRRLSLPVQPGIKLFLPEDGSEQAGRLFNRLRRQLCCSCPPPVAAMGHCRRPPGAKAG